MISIDMNTWKINKTIDLGEDENMAAIKNGKVFILKNQTNQISIIGSGKKIGRLSSINPGRLTLPE